MLQTVCGNNELLFLLKLWNVQINYNEMKAD